MKFAILAFLVLAVFVSGKPNQAPSKEEQKPNPNAPAMPAEQKDKITTNHSHETDDNPPHWYTALKRPEWWLVGAALLTLAAIAYQAKEMARADLPPFPVPIIM